MMRHPFSNLRSSLFAVMLAVSIALAWGQSTRSHRPETAPAPQVEPSVDPELAAAEAEQAEVLRAILRRAYTNEALLKSTPSTRTAPGAVPGPSAPADRVAPAPAPAPAPPLNATATAGPVIPETPPPAETPAPAATAVAPPPVASPAIDAWPPAATPVATPPRAAAPPGFAPGPSAAAAPRPLQAPPAPTFPRTAEIPALEPGIIATSMPHDADNVPYLYALSAAPLVQVFEEYSKLTGRTVLHPSNIQGTVTLNTAGNLNREEAIQALQGALALNGITLILQGEKFVKAVPMQNSLQEGGAIVSRDAEDLPDSEQYVTQVVQLRAVIPSEVAQLLQSFAKTPNGIVPIDGSMILVIRDYASNVKRMLELVERIDIEPESEYNLEVIPIKYGRVTDLFDTMSALISGTEGGLGASRAVQQQPAGALRGGPLTSSSRLGGAGSGFRGTGVGGGMRGYQTPYNQPYAPYEYEPLGATAATPVGTTTGATFQQRLNTILSRAAGDGERTEVLGDARVVPDERSNSLIVYANRQDMRMITNIVSKVDVLLAQVLIEGIVVAVVLGDSQELGVSWYQTPKRFGSDFSGAGAINSGFFGVLTNLPSATPTGFSYWGRLGDDVNVAVQALATDSRVRILQRPRIQTSHAVPGSFFSGSTVPYVTGFVDFYGGVGGSTRSQVQQVQVGVQLDVTPYITPDGLVVLDIFQDISQLGEFVKIDQNDVPTTTSRTASATLSVRDGETIMLGGYIEDSRSSGKSGVPLLKDIPGLGALFRSSSKRNSRAELILLMKVTVLKSPTEASAFAEIERSLLPGLSKAQREFDRAQEMRPVHDQR